MKIVAFKIYKKNLKYLKVQNKILKKIQKLCKKK